MRIIARVAHQAFAWATRLGLVVIAGLVLLNLAGVIRLYTVESGSMWPTMPVGSLVIAVPADANQVAVDDVVTVRSSETGEKVTHRIVNVEALPGDPSTRVLTLRGDNNTTNDPAPYVVDQVDKKVASAPYIGGLVQWLNHGYNRIYAITLIIGLSLLSARSVSAKHRGQTSSSSQINEHNYVGAHAL